MQVGLCGLCGPHFTKIRVCMLLSAGATNSCGPTGSSEKPSRCGGVPGRLLFKEGRSPPGGYGQAGGGAGGGAGFRPPGQR